MQPSPNGRRVGIRIVTFEAFSGFTHVTARRIAQPPKATFVTRLQPCRLPARAARQLPDQSTTLRVESSSTDDPRLRGALPLTDIRTPRRSSVHQIDRTKKIHLADVDAVVSEDGIGHRDVEKSVRDCHLQQVILAADDLAGCPGSF